jgi:hypothetical protein
MGADSLASDDDLRISSSSPKVAKFPNFLLGFAGSYGAGQKFFDAARGDKSMTRKDLIDIRVPGSDWSLLVADATGLYEIDASRGLVRMKRHAGVSYGVIGSGSGVALGSLYCWHEGRESLTTALKAAAEHTNRVKGPFKIVSLERSDTGHQR